MQSKFFKDKELECHGVTCGPCKKLPTQDLVNKLDEIREKYNKPITLTCALRCPIHNKEVKGALSSKHIAGNAADLSDPNKEIMNWILPKLEELNIWIENPDATTNWVHIQVVPYGSWKPGMSRIFNP